MKLYIIITLIALIVISASVYMLLNTNNKPTPEEEEPEEEEPEEYPEEEFPEEEEPEEEFPEEFPEEEFPEEEFPEEELPEEDYTYERTFDGDNLPNAGMFATINDNGLEDVNALEISVNWKDNNSLFESYTLIVGINEVVVLQLQFTTDEIRLAGGDGLSHIFNKRDFLFWNDNIRNETEYPFTISMNGDYVIYKLGSEYFEYTHKFTTPIQYFFLKNDPMSAVKDVVLTLKAR